MTFPESVLLVQTGKGDQIKDPKERAMAEEIVTQTLAVGAEQATEAQAVKDKQVKQVGLAGRVLVGFGLSKTHKIVPIGAESQDTPADALEQESDPWIPEPAGTPSKAIGPAFPNTFASFCEAAATLNCSDADFRAAVSASPDNPHSALKALHVSAGAARPPVPVVTDRQGPPPPDPVGTEADKAELKQIVDRSLAARGVKPAQ